MLSSLTAKKKDDVGDALFELARPRLQSMLSEKGAIPSDHLDEVKALIAHNGSQ